MKKLVLILFVGVLMVGMTGIANAVPFDFGTNGANNSTGNTNHWTIGSGWGTSSVQLDVLFSLNSSLPSLAFDLNAVGDSFTFQFGTANLREEDISHSATDNLSLAAVLYFVLPPVGGETIQGLGTAIEGNVVDAQAGYSYRTWDWSTWSYVWVTVPPVPEATDLIIAFNSLNVAFNGGTFSIDIAPVSFDVQGPQDVNAKITLTSSVPEPATMLLLGMGLLGMGFVGRRRFKK